MFASFDNLKLNTTKVCIKTDPNMSKSQIFFHKKSPPQVILSRTLGATQHRKSLLGKRPQSSSINVKILLEFGVVCFNTNDHAKRQKMTKMSIHEKSRLNYHVPALN